MDEQAARIIQRALHTLKLPEDINSARYHRKIAMVSIDKTTAELNRAASWLKVILEANRRENIYPHNSLAKTVEELWYRNCMYCAIASPWSLKLFIQNRFHFAPMTTCKHFSILTASCIKHSLKRVRI